MALLHNGHGRHSKYVTTDSERLLIEDQERMLKAGVAEIHRGSRAGDQRQA
jgi:hypothetical protein